MALAWYAAGRRPCNRNSQICKNITTSAAPVLVGVVQNAHRGHPQRRLRTAATRSPVEFGLIPTQNRTGREECHHNDEIRVGAQRRTRRAALMLLDSARHMEASPVKRFVICGLVVTLGAGVLHSQAAGELRRDAAANRLPIERSSSGVAYGDDPSIADWRVPLHRMGRNAATRHNWISSSTSPTSLLSQRITLFVPPAAAGQSAPQAPTNLRIVSTSAGSPSSVTASAGTPQSASVSSAFATSLKATVRDVNSNALSGITVTFTAPVS